MTVTSRMGYAMARDVALPGSSWLNQVNESTKTPIRMIMVIFILDVLFCLMILVNKTAFAAITSITTIGY